jgi:hypothetical protein
LNKFESVPRHPFVRFRNGSITNGLTESTNSRWTKRIASLPKV